MDLLDKEANVEYCGHDFNDSVNTLEPLLAQKLSDSGKKQDESTRVAS